LHAKFITTDNRADAKHSVDKDGFTDFDVSLQDLILFLSLSKTVKMPRSRQQGRCTIYGI